MFHSTLKQNKALCEDASTLEHLINFKNLMKLSIHMEPSWLLILLSSLLVVLLLFGLYVGIRFWREPIE